MSSNKKASNYYSMYICEGAGTMYTSNCKFLEPSSKRYTIPYKDFVYPATEFGPPSPWNNQIRFGCKK